MSLPRYLAANYDREWETWLNRIVKHVTRTAIIAELCGGSDRIERVKYAVDRAIKDVGVARARPRGEPVSFETKHFMTSQRDRFAGAILLALDPMVGEPKATLNVAAAAKQVHEDVKDEMLATANRLLEVYERYLHLTGGFSSGHVSFETYYEMLKGIEARAVLVHTCPVCRSRSPYNSQRPTKPTCPVCVEYRFTTLAPGFRDAMARRLDGRAQQAICA